MLVNPMENSAAASSELERDRSNPADVENVFVNPTDDGNIRVYNEKGQFIGEIDSFTELENIGSTHGVYMLEQCGVWYKIVK